MIKRILSILSFIIVVLILTYIYLCRPVSPESSFVLFTVPKDEVVTDPSEELVKMGIIRYAMPYRIISAITQKGIHIPSGGYKISKSQWMWQIIGTLSGKPDFVWVTISSCLRYEQTGEILAEKLGWNNDQYDSFIALFKEKPDEYFEGILYPDTYLLPTDESPEQIAKRMTTKFQEQIASLMDEFLRQNIKWTTGVKMASLIAREAAGADDMNLISGIIWNRLNKGIKLEIDATMQYTKGKRENDSWWGSIDLSEKQSDSPYNTYKYKGLPPTAICSPRIAYVQAVLNPVETDCIFYLHSNDKQIHCSKTYEEHRENIDLYLR